MIFLWMRDLDHITWWYETVLCYLHNNLFCALFVWWTLLVKPKHVTRSHPIHKRRCDTQALSTCVSSSEGDVPHKNKINLEDYFNTMHRASFIILYYEQQMHNYFTNYHTPTCFDTIVSSSDSLWSIPCQVTPVFQMQLSVIQFTIKMFHIGFMPVLIL